MSIPDRIYKAMREGFEYDPVTIACNCHISEQDASRYMKVLHKNGLIELVAPNRYLKDRKYKTKQRSLSL